MSYSASASGKSHSYIQLFRNGILEAVEGLLLQPHNQKLWISSVAFERELISGFYECLSILKTISVELPIFVFLTLIGVKGYSMLYGKHVTRESASIDRDVLFLPEAIVESYNVKAESILKPIFDSVWNACGLPRSLHYDKNGDWIDQAVR